MPPSFAEQKKQLENPTLRIGRSRFPTEQVVMLDIRCRQSGRMQVLDIPVEPSPHKGFCQLDVIKKTVVFVVFILFRYTQQE